MTADDGYEFEPFDDFSGLSDFPGFNSDTFGADQPSPEQQNPPQEPPMPQQTQQAAYAPATPPAPDYTRPAAEPNPEFSKHQQSG